MDRFTGWLNSRYVESNIEWPVGIACNVFYNKELWPFSAGLATAVSACSEWKSHGKLELDKEGRRHDVRDRTEGNVLEEVRG